MPRPKATNNDIKKYGLNGALQLAEETDCANALGPRNKTRALHGIATLRAALDAIPQDASSAQKEQLRTAAWEALNNTMLIAEKGHASDAGGRKTSAFRAPSTPNIKRPPSREKSK